MVKVYPKKSDINPPKLRGSTREYFWICSGCSHKCSVDDSYFSVPYPFDLESRTCVCESCFSQFNDLLFSTHEEVEVYIGRLNPLNLSD